MQSHEVRRENSGRRPSLRPPSRQGGGRVGNQERARGHEAPTPEAGRRRAQSVCCATGREAAMSVRLLSQRQARSATTAGQLARLSKGHGSRSRFPTGVRASSDRYVARERGSAPGRDHLSESLPHSSHSGRPPRQVAGCVRHRSPQISVCSEISSASSTSMPRYLTVDSSLECPRSSCTARRFLVRR